MYEEVKSFIEENVYDSEGFERLDTVKQKQLINNAINLLNKFLGDVYKGEEIPVEDIVDQLLFMLKKDDTFKRAEMGMTSMSVEGGASLSFDSDRVSSLYIAPELNIKYDLGNGNKRRRVGRYNVNQQDTYRNGMNNKRDKRYVYYGRDK